MLGEGFLRLLLYREERKFASASKQKRLQTHMDRANCVLPESNSTVVRAEPAEAGPELNPNESSGLRVTPPGPVGLSIPGFSPLLTIDPDFTMCLDDCSLLDQYPDLQVADSGRISNSRATMAHQGPLSDVSGQPEMVVSIPDQGYLAMGANENISLDLPGSGLEPMSNSVLNGLLDKQLEKVYMQHLTDNLARCNSDLGSSLLHGLVPPPQPSSMGPESLEASLGTGSEGDSNRKISYLNTHTSGPCSSNFSSPLLRISENVNVQPQ